ncbi:MAG: response regulator, partial [bacterium]
MTLSTGSRAPKILVVDDEEAILDLLRRRLEAMGCEISVLPGGSQVLQTVREQLPDLVLLDVMMPDLDGFSVCESLKQDPHVRDIPVLLMTARAE